MVDLLTPKIFRRWHKVVWDDDLFYLTVMRLDVLKVGELSLAVVDYNIMILDVSVAKP